MHEMITKRELRDGHYLPISIRMFSGDPGCTFEVYLPTRGHSFPIARLTGTTQIEIRFSEQDKRLDQLQSRLSELGFVNPNDTPVGTLLIVNVANSMLPLSAPYQCRDNVQRAFFMVPGVKRVYGFLNVISCFDLAEAYIDLRKRLQYFQLPKIMRSVVDVCDMNCPLVRIGRQIRSAIFELCGSETS